MPKSRVYLVRTSDESGELEVARAVKKLFKAAGFEDIFKGAGLTAVKIHFGEKGNKGWIAPQYAKAAVECLEGAGASPFLADTNTLYAGQRSNSYDHLKLAASHGFSVENIGAPVIIADGLLGQNRSPVKVDGKHFKEVQLAPDIVHADAMLVLTHVTGHIVAGFGGSIKNIAMGCATRGGKLSMHTGARPELDRDKCTGCGTCAKWCPAGAIVIEDGFPVVADGLCIGCGECLTVCRQDAMTFSWGGPDIQEKMAEYALGVASTKKGRVGYINFITHVTKNCNCIGHAEEPSIADVGIAASIDPVAIDKASYDLANLSAGKDFFKDCFPNVDGMTQMRRGEKLGLGRMDYELVEL